MLKKKDLPRGDKKKVKAMVGHAFVIYKENRKKKYWKCKNSWGKDHGDGGKLRIEKNAISFKMYDVFFRRYDLTDE